jgi:hypothetical protein
LASEIIQRLTALIRPDDNQHTCNFAGGAAGALEISSAVSRDDELPLRASESVS